MINLKSVKFLIIFILLIFILNIRTNYQLQVNNYIYWKISNFLVDSRYNLCLLSLFFLLKNKFIFILLYSMLDELSWINLNVTNSIKSFNTLTNGFFIIHPILILLSFSTLITLLLNINIKFIFNIYIQNNKNILNNLLILILSAIFLGAYWANQEVGWGGWWSWDYVENINLILFTIALLSVHKKNKNKKINLIYSKKVLILFIIFLHLCVRLDLGDSIHSFIQTNEIEYVYLILALLNIFILFNLIQYKYTKTINIINISYYFIIFLLLLLSVQYLLYIQNNNYKVLLTILYSFLLIYLILNESIYLNYCIFDVYFFISIVIFKVFNSSKKFKVTISHFVTFSILAALSFNYLELTLYYSKKNLLLFNIINLGDFSYNLRLENFVKTYASWYSNTSINLNWNFFLYPEIFFYKYLYEFKSILTSDNIFLSYSSNTFQIYIYCMYILIFIIKNTSINYKYKRLCI